LNFIIQQTPKSFSVAELNYLLAKGAGLCT